MFEWFIGIMLILILLRCRDGSLARNASIIQQDLARFRLHYNDTQKLQREELKTKIDSLEIIVMDLRDELSQKRRAR